MAAAEPSSALAWSEDEGSDDVLPYSDATDSRPEVQFRHEEWQDEAPPRRRNGRRHRGDGAGRLLVIVIVVIVVIIVIKAKVHAARARALALPVSHVAHSLRASRWSPDLSERVLDGGQ